MKGNPDRPGGLLTSKPTWPNTSRDSGTSAFFALRRFAMKPRGLKRGGRSETGNRLLDQLPKEEYERLAPLLELVPLAAKQNLYGVNDPIRHVYFPKTGMISVVILLEDGRQVESGTVGNEG